MKKVGLFLLAVVMVTGLAGCGGGSDSFSSPSDYCPLNNLLAVNTSKATTQELMVDEISKGAIQPGGYLGIRLELGVHTLQLKGIAGGPGCVASSVLIEVCQQELVECSH